MSTALYSVLRDQVYRAGLLFVRAADAASQFNHGAPVQQSDIS